jgi:hypothetical protein
MDTNISIYYCRQPDRKVRCQFRDLKQTKGKKRRRRRRRRRRKIIIIKIIIIRRRRRRRRSQGYQFSLNY